MNVRFRMVDIDGDGPAEVAEVIEKVLKDKSRDDIDRVKQAIIQTLASTKIDHPAVVQEMQPIAAKVIAAMTPASDDVTPESVVATPPTTLAPVAEWIQIPEMHRAWNSTGSICHIVMDPANPTAAVCGHELGMLRDPNRDPMNDARPCAACNRALERARRNG